MMYRCDEPCSWVKGDFAVHDVHGHVVYFYRRNIPKLIVKLLRMYLGAEEI
jgi:hypothetical protein